MSKIILLLGACVAVATAGIIGPSQDIHASTNARAAKVKVIRNLWFELVGQFENSAPGVTPVTHMHYGYLSWVQGISAFAADPETPATAQLTFFANGKTTALTINGPLRSGTRVGTLSLYSDPSHNSDFANPDTFRDGTRILVAVYRHQPIGNSVTGEISLFSHDRITYTRPFETSHGLVQLGQVGETFDEHYTGATNMPGPPSGYFVGYAISG
jgi:hypothetical protein